MNNEAEFREWLGSKRGKDRKQSTDIISRCKRIERVFDLDLDETVKSSDNYNALLERIVKESGDYLLANQSKYAHAQLKTAAKVYRDFKDSSKRKT